MRNVCAPTWGAGTPLPIIPPGRECKRRRLSFGETRETFFLDKRRKPLISAAKGDCYRCKHHSSLRRGMERKGFNEEWYLHNRIVIMENEPQWKAVDKRSVMWHQHSSTLTWCRPHWRRWWQLWRLGSHSACGWSCRTLRTLAHGEFSQTGRCTARLNWGPRKKRL